MWILDQTKTKLVYSQISRGDNMKKVLILDTEASSLPLEFKYKVFTLVDEEEDYYKFEADYKGYKEVEWCVGKKDSKIL